MSTQLSQIALKAKFDRKVRFTSLAHLLTPEFLKESGEVDGAKYLVMEYLAGHARGEDRGRSAAGY
jgi:hypothetical protein